MTGCVFPTLTQADVAALGEIEDEEARRVIIAESEMWLTSRRRAPHLAKLAHERFERGPSWWENRSRVVKRGCKRRIYGLARVRGLSLELAFALMRMSGWYKAGRLTTMRAAHWASYVKSSGSELPPRFIAPCRFTPTGPVVAMSKAAKVRGKR